MPNLVVIDVSSHTKLLLVIYMLNISYLIRNSISSVIASLNSSSHWERKIVFLQHIEGQDLIGGKVIVVSIEGSKVDKTNNYTF